MRLTMPWLEDGAVWWLERTPRRGRPRRAREGSARRRARRTSCPRASTCGRASTSTAAARTAIHDGVAYCLATSTTSACTGVDPGRRAGADHARGAGQGGTATRTGASRPTAGSGSVSASGTRRTAGSSDVVNELVALPTDGSAEPQRHRRWPRLLLQPPHLARRQRGSASSPGTSRGCPGTAASSSSPDLGAGRRRSERHARRRRATARSRSGSRSGAPTGDLVFASDRSGWWNLERIRDGERAVLHAAEAEFGYPAWVFGSSLVRVPRRRAHRVRVRQRRLHRVRRARPGNGIARPARRSARRLVVGVAVRRRRGLDRGRHRGLGDGSQPGRPPRPRSPARDRSLRRSARVPRRHGATSRCRARSSSRPRAG